MTATQKIISVPNPKLTIHICHLPERVQQLNTLVNNLTTQAEMWGGVEVLINSAPRGTITTGKKRNLMMAETTGQYVAAIDDDDNVTTHYIELIFRSISTTPDCIGIVGILNEPGKPTWTFRHSITVRNWCKDKTKRIYFRPPNHLNPIKTEIAKRCPFPDITIGEDRAFSDAVKVLTKTEVFIEEPIYIYTPSKK